MITNLHVKAARAAKIKLRRRRVDWETIICASMAIALANVIGFTSVMF